MTVVDTVKAGVKAFAVVTIHGRRWAFLVDTGATTTVLDAGVATSLGLAKVGTPTKGTTVGCSTAPQPVKVDDWSIGGQRLPASVLPAQPTDLGDQRVGGVPVGGLLGADLFYLYGTLRLDFRAGRMGLGVPVPAGRSSFPLDTQVQGGSVLVLARATVHGRPAGLVVDTGASISQISAEFAAAAGLRTVGPPVKVGSISCSVLQQPVTLDQVRIGGVDLPASLAGSSPSKVSDATRGRIQGLLGAPVLARYGTVTFDFVRDRVVLGS
ncbi:aspartyl protease family protein [Nakamurella endophytica]|uniref:aspartyl protease family protein n=1 Tax=Nakamurella endophytica TaxID=1748367 RepID=UPI00166A9A36|nr:aspartyl protease family protein [Nakamurella endophytica]